MKLLFVTALIFSQVSFAAAKPATNTDVSTLTKILNDSRVKKSIGDNDVKNIDIEKSSVSTQTNYTVTMTLAEPGLNFPDGQPSSHPCFLTVTANYSGGVAGTDFNIDDPVLACAQNSPSLGLGGN